VTQILRMEVNEVEVPKELLPEPPKQNRVWLYALSRKLIGISFKPLPEWSEKSLWEGEVEVKETPSSLVIVLPDTVSGFYGTTNDNVTVSVSQKTGNIIVDIELE